MSDPSAPPSSSTLSTTTPISTPSDPFPQDMTGDDHPPEFKKEGDDWVALFNPSRPQTGGIRSLSVVYASLWMEKYVATGGNQMAQIFDVETGDKIWYWGTSCWRMKSLIGKGTFYLRSVCFSPDGKYLVTGGDDKLIKVWDIEKKSVPKVLEGHTQGIYSIDYSSDGQFLVSGTADKTVRVWNMEDSTSKLFDNPLTHQDNAAITSVKFSSDRQYVAAGYLDNHVRIWEVATGQLVGLLQGHRGAVYHWRNL
ncbi:general transcription repressor [Marasmius sp. AFHP31]|nr:general transcription repressor [Marasmius sp. AFHP31]